MIAEIWAHQITCGDVMIWVFVSLVLRLAAHWLKGSS